MLGLSCTSALFFLLWFFDLRLWGRPDWAAVGALSGAVGALVAVVGLIGVFAAVAQRQDDLAALDRRRRSEMSEVELDVRVKVMQRGWAEITLTVENHSEERIRRVRGVVFVFGPDRPERFAKDEQEPRLISGLRDPFRPIVQDWGRIGADDLESIQTLAHWKNEVPLIVGGVMGAARWTDRQGQIWFKVEGMEATPAEAIGEEFMTAVVGNWPPPDDPVTNVESASDG